MLPISVVFLMMLGLNANSRTVNKNIKNLIQSSSSSKAKDDIYVSLGSPEEGAFSEAYASASEGGTVSVSVSVSS